MSSLPRRSFIQHAGASLLAAWALPAPAFADAASAAADALRAPPARPEALSAAAFRTLEAVTARIVPSDTTPGAREAGAAWFIDRLVARWMRDMKAPLVGTLAACDAAAVAKGASTFSALAPDPQDAVIAALPVPQRRLLIQLTCAGLLSNPIHGGNRGEVGWKLVGHDSAMQFTPPYGYYDQPENLARLVAEAAAARKREATR